MATKKNSEKTVTTTAAKSEKIRKNIRLLIIVVISMMFGSIITIFLKDSNIKSVKKVSSTEYSEFEPLYEAYDHIKNEYYKNIDTTTLVDGAIDGMLNSIGDKHTMYFDKESKKEFEQELSGTYYGIGAEIQLNSDNKKIGYISVSLFGQKTYSQFYNALSDLEKENMSSLIIDLRGNSGGYLTTVTQMLSIFMDKDTVIYKMKTKNKIVDYNSLMAGKKDYKVVILVDENSASASEIMASSMKEKYGAILVGKTTYGKGTVQSTANLSDGTMIKYTIQEWLTPNGNSINGKGIKPDYEVDLSEEYKNNPTNDNDNQLQKAIEILK